MGYPLRQPAPRKRVFGLRPHIFKMWATAIIIGGLGLMFLFGNKGLWKIFILKQTNDDKREQVDSLAVVKREMQQRIAGLKRRDSTAIEIEARSENIRMVYEGEKIYIVKEKPDKR